MCAYVSSADFRPGSGKWYTHGIPLTEDDADNNSLSDAITAMTQAFDLYTDDHFEPEPGGEPETTMTLDLPGSGGPNITVPKRIRSLTDVSLRDFNGNLISQLPSVYRVIQSIVDGKRTEGDLDQISVIPGQWLSGVGYWGDNFYTGSWQYFPLGVNSVQITGTFSWPSTPEQVKRAVSLMVYDAIKPGTDVLRRADRWATPTANFTVAVANPTGMPEVDNIIGQFTRNRIPAI